MAGGIRRNSLQGEIETTRAILLSMRDEDAPLAEHVDRCRMEATAAGSRPPADPPAKDRDYEIWLRRTGWR